MFSAPIPGQSLTSEPRNYAWENPPEYAAPEDALIWHIRRLEEPKKIKSMLGLLELGLDVVTMTEGLLRGAVADGRHSVDVSMIIAPVIHEYIVGTADAAGVEYSEGLDEEDVDFEGIDYSIREREARKILDQMDEESGNVDLSPLKEEEPMDEMPMEEPEVKEEPKGLMARRTA
jgi:hypothetical protein